jgi:hypothetical protein
LRIEIPRVKFQAQEFQIPNSKRIREKKEETRIKSQDKVITLYSVKLLYLTPFKTLWLNKNIRLEKMRINHATVIL